MVDKQDITPKNSGHALTGFNIDVDHKKKIIKVGEWSTTDLIHDFFTSENDHSYKNEILLANNIEIKNQWSKELGLRLVNKEMATYLGVKFNYRLRAASYNLWIKPIKDYCYKFCYYSNRRGQRGFCSKSQIKRLWKNKSKVDTLVSDGLDHLAPLVIYFGGTPKTLKKKMGKSLWKKLSKNSLYKNKLIVRLLEMIFNDKARVSQFSRFEHCLEIIKAITELKVSLIKNAYFEHTFYWANRRKKSDMAAAFTGNIPRLLWLNKCVPTSNYHKLHLYNKLYLEAQSMSHMLNIKFNKNCTPQMMTKNYEDLSLLLIKKQIQKNCLASFENFQDQWHFNFKNKKELYQAIEFTVNELRNKILKELTEKKYYYYVEESLIAYIVNDNCRAIFASIEKRILMSTIDRDESEMFNAGMAF